MGIVNPVRGQLSTETEGAGQTKEVNALTTVINELNGNIDQFNVKAAFAKDVVEPAFSTYKQTLTDGTAILAAAAGAAATPYWLPPGGISSFQPIAQNPAAVSAAAPMYFDPADWTAGTRATKLRVRAICAVGGTAPAVTITVGLYPVTGPTAGAYVPGVVVAGSTVPFATPGVNTMTQGNSGDFTAPAAGFYTLGYVISGATAASSATQVRAQLQMRQV